MLHYISRRRWLLYCITLSKGSTGVAPVGDEERYQTFSIEGRELTGLWSKVRKSRVDRMADLGRSLSCSCPSSWQLADLKIKTQAVELWMDHSDQLSYPLGPCRRFVCPCIGLIAHLMVYPFWAPTAMVDNEGQRIGKHFTEIKNLPRDSPTQGLHERHILICWCYTSHKSILSVHIVALECAKICFI